MLGTAGGLGATASARQGYPGLGPSPRLTPGTGDPEHMVDDLGGGRGRLPTQEHVRRMLALVESLPGG